jgi:hypothetical protein
MKLEENLTKMLTYQKKEIESLKREVHTVKNIAVGYKQRF